MGTEMEELMDQSFDCIETAFSNTTRKIIREINAEWQAVTKYRNDLSAKEDELQAAKENLMHLNEIKSQREKCIQSTQSRIEHLKLSNNQLKIKLNNLKKEEEKIAKKYSEEDECLKKKLLIYEEKWRKRYEARYLKNPKLQEKERALKELKEITEKVNSLKLDIQKYKKDLFQAKCKRNKRTTEESQLYPLNTFIISIAKIYLETRKVCEESQTMSEEISNTKKNIASRKRLEQQMEISVDTTFTEKNSNIEKKFEPTSIAERDYSMQTDVNSYDSTATSKEATPQIQICGTFESNKSDLQISKEQYQVSNRKLTRQPKVQKWMEKLKIFVPNFSVLSTTISDKFYGKISDEILDDQPQKLENLGKEHTLLFQHKPASKSLSDDQKSNNDVFVGKETPVTVPSEKFTNIFTNSSFNQNVPLCELKEQTSGISMNAESSPEQVNKNVSKYFKICDSTSALNTRNGNKTEETVNGKSFALNNTLADSDVMDVDTESSKQSSTDKPPNQSNTLQSKSNFQSNTFYAKVQEAEERKFSQNEILHQTATHTENKDVVRVSPLTYDDTIDSSNINHNSEINNQCVVKQIPHMVNQIIKSENMCENEMPINIPSTLLASTMKENIPNELTEKCPELHTFSSSHAQSPSTSEQKNEDNVIILDNSGITELGPKSEETVVSKTSRSDSLSNSAGRIECHTPLSNDGITKIDGSSSKVLKKTSQNSTEGISDADISNLISFSADSPGFTYTTRLMYQKNIISNVLGNSPGQLYNNTFMPMTFFNNNSCNNQNLILTQPDKEEDEKNDFLASAYEDYLNDSPPAMKAGTEKPMFAFTEDSPDTEKANTDFFPLFAADDVGGSDKNSPGSNGKQFVLNFGSSSKSTNASPEFKFLF